MSPRKQHLSDATGPIHIGTHRPAQVQARQNLSTEKGEWTQSPTPKKEAKLGKGK